VHAATPSLFFISKNLFQFDLLDISTFVFKNGGREREGARGRGEK
jgi:hypothetical protein